MEIRSGRQDKTWCHLTIGRPGNARNSELQAKRVPYNVAISCDVLYRSFPQGSVAQSVEQRPFKALVPGSSPGRPTPLNP